MSVIGLKECHMEWDEPVIIELSKEPDAEGACLFGSVPGGSSCAMGPSFGQITCAAHGMGAGSCIANGQAASSLCMSGVGA